MRIWYQSMAPIRQLGRYTDALTRHAALACSPGVEVAFNGERRREPIKSTVSGKAAAIAFNAPGCSSIRNGTDDSGQTT